MALENYCAACTYLGEEADYEGKYYCESKGEDHYAFDPKCYNFCEAYSRSNSARENMYDNSYNHNSSSSSSSSSYDSPICYLTTAMCNILGYPDDNYYLQMLRTFRDETLKKDVKYIPILLTYDTIGPQIAYNLYQDEFKTTIAKTLFTAYITKAVSAIEENKTQEAVNIYIAMTNTLARRYNINTRIMHINPNSINLDNINMETLGHGRIRKLKNI